MKRLNNFNWKVYWYLTIIKEVKPKVYKNILHRQVLCKCRCWNFTKWLLYTIKVWGKKSCGCLHKKHWFSNQNNAFYNCYRNILQRCNNTKNARYKNYWWRWIKNEWQNFKEFKNDMYESFIKHCEEFWKKDTTIDRINNDWNYCKGNCRWATRKEQAYNKSTNTNIQPCIKYGYKIKVKNILNKKPSIEINNIKYKNIFDASKRLWISRQLLTYRLHNNYYIFKKLQ